ncbi:pyrroline-5-carboxylate reductase [Pseudalkalibacillus berkeleyi]|uniref:Pyrroline-5-carboxylate reductase n=1 Tax=Pseudalkalibacillus berkeleyi TaxID=1069813 RepID=A0ABS9H0C7_9BACL|nr:pyrroline-5-carboxylate reductase [Pseudalkalibacillus berkeleyi]MCF6137400.1 pyrroline-5-carboxylate reductase [Pseudalkalibacillus berkeleyi]
MEKYSLLIVGAGRMAEAVLAGLVKQEASLFKSITVSNHSDQQRLQRLASEYQVEVTGEWYSKVSEVDVILLAAPPKAHDSILKELATAISDQLVMTVAAGIDTTYMEERLPQGTPVCWLMPNTAALVQRSMTTFTCGKYVSDFHKTLIKHVLESIGSYEELTAEQVHDLTAITGSAPAFLYLLTEALEEKATSYGISKEQAKLLVTKMISGSAAMLDTGTPANELRDQVTSPGGSTAAGVSLLEGQNFKQTLKDAVVATNNHARKNH